MAGGTVSIGFDYRKQLDKAVKDIEESFDKALGSKSYGKDFETQIASFKDMLKELKGALEDSFKGLSGTKLDTDKFDAFREKVTRDFSRVDGEIDSLNKSMNSLNELLGISGDSVDLSNAINQFKELQNFINANNEAVTKLLKTLKNTDSTVIFDTPTFSIDDARSKINEIKQLYSDLDFNAEDKYKDLNKSKEIHDEFKKLSKEYDDLFEKRGELQDKLEESIGQPEEVLLNFRAELSKTELEIGKVSESMMVLFSKAKEKKFSWINDQSLKLANSGAIGISEELKQIQLSAKSVMSDLQKYVDLIDSSTAKVSKQMDANTGEVKLQVKISTRDKTLLNELTNKIDILQNYLNINPLILPVKMVVSSARTTSDDPLKTSQHAIKQAQKELANSNSTVSMVTDQLPQATLQQALQDAVRAANESKKRIQEIYDKSPVAVHLYVPEKEIEDIQNAVLNGNGETKIDISAQIESTTKKVDSLITKLGTVNQQVNDTKKNNKFAGLSEEIKKSISDLSSLKDILTSIKDLESTIARATNVYTSDEITAQWNKTKFLFDYISDNKDNLNLNTQKKQITELMAEYQKYVDMGGKNPLRYLTDNEDTVKKLYNQLNKLKTVTSESINVSDETKSFNNIKNSVDDLTTAIGVTKVDAINTEVNMMKDAASKEVQSIESIREEIQKICDLLYEIKGIKLPKIDIKGVDNLEKLNSVFDNITKNIGNISLDEPILNKISNISNIINDVNNKTKNNYIEKSKNNDAEKSIENKDEIHEELKETINEFKNIKEKFNDFIKELGNREYGNSKNISKAQEKEYKNVRADIYNMFNNFPDSSIGSISSGFSNGAKKPDEYKHTISKLNSYQKLLRSDTNSVLQSLKFGIITDEEAEKELKILQTLDETIQERRKLLNGYKEVVKAEINTISNKSPILNESNRYVDSDLTSQSIESIKNESTAFEQIIESAESASNAKDEFRKSNELLALSANNSTESITDEANALSIIENIDLDKNSEEFKNAAKSARQYFNELGEIASITRTSGTYNTYNSHTGKTEQEQRISYRITDVNGNSRTVNPQGELIGSKDIIKVVDEYKEYLRIQEEIYKINLKEITNGKITAEQLSKRDKLLQDIEKQTDKLFGLEQKGLENAELRDEIARREQAYQKTLIDTQVQKLVTNPLTDFENKLTKLEINKNLSKQTDEYKEKLQEIDTLLDELKSYEQSGIELFNQDTISNVNNITQQIENLFSTVSDMDKVANQAKATGIISNIEDYISKNSSLRMTKQGRGYIEELRTLQTELKNTALTAPELQDIVIKFNNIKTSITEAGLAGRSFFDVIKSKAFYMAAETFARLFSIQDIIRYVRTAVTTIRQLDTALVDLRKTTTMSSSELDRFYKSSNAIAKQMGVTTEEIINQASAWSRLGYSSADAAETMAELSSQFAAISPGMDVDQATDGLVSSMKAFGIEVSDAERKISDNINRIGNTAATSNQEIVDMLTRSSAAMATANNTIEETIALETAAVEITRNAETTGTAFKTLAMRIRGYDEETEELSDDLKNIAGDIADLTKIDGKGGISLFTDETKETYKSTYQILKEISEIWDQLSDKNQAEFCLCA